MFDNIDYNIYRCDRDIEGGKTRSGGVLTLISKKYNSEIIYKQNKNYELLVTSLKTKNKNLIIINVYFPPIPDLVFYVEFIENVNTIISKYKNSEVIIAGDFNLAKCYFTTNKDNEMKIITNNKNNKINEIAKFLYINLKDLKLLQFNNYKNTKSNTLDLIFYNTKIDIKIPSNPLVKVDIFHPPLDIKIKTELIHNKVDKTMFYNYKKANYENIFKKLSLIDWDNNLNNIDINANVKFFYDSLNRIIQEEVPKTLLIKDKFPKFFSKKLKRLIKIKKIYHKQYKKSKKHKYYYYKKFNKII